MEGALLVIYQLALTNLLSVRHRFIYLKNYENDTITNRHQKPPGPDPGSDGSCVFQTIVQERHRLTVLAPWLNIPGREIGEGYSISLRYWL